MIKKICFYFFLFFCFILNIAIDINLNNYINILELVFNKKIYLTSNLYAFICFVNSEIINQIVMELVVIEKHAYLQLKLQIESLSAQIESVKKKIGPVEMEK